MVNTIEIELSKTKLLFLLIGAGIFVALGILFILNPESIRSNVFSNLELIRIVGVVSLVFFGLCFVYIAIKLFDTKVGLSINENGIIDNSNAASVGLIDWEDITTIKTIQIASNKILLLETSKPEKYIERARNGLISRAMKANCKMYGTPISIISNSLKITHDDLEKLLLEEFGKRVK
ncbi:STM3941 family protein [Marinifilum flexuosum]|uniref:STM3941 family protein n=1 Tax=Marinifilum flexuosum TaxID=1117708 RepID=UPI00249153BA|nr:STM3941 family protein [Marinifilum flexuosum]